MTKFEAERCDRVVAIDLSPQMISVATRNSQTHTKPGGKLIVLDLIQHETLQDKLSDVIAVPANWIFQLLKNRRVTRSQEAEAAWQEHFRTDKYLTLSQARHIYTKSCPGTKISKHLFWRYSAVWEKPHSIIQPRRQLWRKQS